MIVEWLLRKAPIFSADCIHLVLSVVHLTVYSIIYEHIHLKKAENKADKDSAGQRCRALPEESNDTSKNDTAEDRNTCRETRTGRIVKEEKASTGKGAGNST